MGVRSNAMKKEINNTAVKVCKRGHERAATDKRCKVCKKASDKVYRQSEKGTRSSVRAAMKRQLGILNLDHLPEIPAEYVKARHAQRLVKREVERQAS